MVRQLFVALLTSALLVACQPARVPVGSISQAPPVVAATATPEAQQPSGSVPLAEAVDSMEPQLFWQNFYSLTQIPRPSHHEEQVSAFLAQFGEDLGLETIVDDVGNVIIRKPATKGMEDRQGVVLQAHMDMVAQKTSDSTHDFLTDPIEAYVEDGWVKAVDTTLGADDGSGVAMIMTLLQEDNVAHGPLEGLFTVNEEDGFTGVNALQPGVLQGTILINIDSEEIGVFTIGSAGGVNTDITAQYELEETPADYDRLYASKFPVCKAVTREWILRKTGAMPTACLHACCGWLKINLACGWRALPAAISTTQFHGVPRPWWQCRRPRSRHLPLLSVTSRKPCSKSMRQPSPPCRFKLAESDLPAEVLPEDGQHALVSALYGSPNGVEKMSDSVPGLVETSTNLGILSLADGSLTAGHLTRSAVDSERDDLAQRVQSVFELAGTDAVAQGAYSGWPPNPDSPIVKLMQSEYQSLFGEEAAIEAIHAGLGNQRDWRQVSGDGYDFRWPDTSIGPLSRRAHGSQHRRHAVPTARSYPGGHSRARVGAQRSTRHLRRWWYRCQGKKTAPAFLRRPALPVSKSSCERANA